ncbi:MAG TPA: ferredoxin family protein [Candidatus Limnocylindria bacterium]
MTYVVAAPCVDHNDQSCVDVCPVDCIAADPGPDRKFYIDADACIECGQCAKVCPNEAILVDRELPGEWEVYAAIDAAWYRDPAIARQQVDTLHPA